jgi:hypothetical protein
MEKYLIGISGGINSMAVLCWLIEQPNRPSEIYLFAAHFKEHSPDTFKFVADGIRYARKHFDVVHVKITKNSIIDFFENQNIIPHPANSPCTKRLKIDPINKWAFENGITHDLVGYVKHEIKRRGDKQKKTAENTLFSLSKEYPIGEFTDEWCFEIVKKHIGWFPAIYEIMFTDEDFAEGLCKKNDIGKRAFKHNTCKNMYPNDMKMVKKHFPDKHKIAIELSAKLGKYWGRDKDSFYSEWGRDLGQTHCEICKF